MKIVAVHKFYPEFSGIKPLCKINAGKTASYYDNSFHTSFFGDNTTGRSMVQRTWSSAPAQLLFYCNNNF